LLQLIVFESISLTALLASQPPATSSQSTASLPAAPKSKKMSYQELNRLVFGYYLIALACWLFFSPSSFFGFLGLPSSSNNKHSTTLLPTMSIPQLLATLVATLGYYNIVAAKHSIAPLIKAGQRGGLLAVAMFGLLVYLGYLEPIALVIPSIDLLSILLLYVFS